LVNTVEDFIRSLPVSKSTEVTYKRQINKFHSWIVQNNESAISRCSLEMYLTEMNRKVSKTTLPVYCSILRKYLVFLKDKNKLSFDPLPCFSKVIEESSIESINNKLAEYDIEVIISSAGATNTFYKYRNQTILILILLVGLNIEELISLTFENVLSETICINGRKYSLNKKARTKLSAYLQLEKNKGKATNFSDRVFTDRKGKEMTKASIKRIISSSITAAGLDFTYKDIERHMISRDLATSFTPAVVINLPVSRKHLISYITADSKNARGAK